jgi:hypothetical protein
METGLGEAAERVRSVVARRWLAVLVAAASFSQLLAAYRVLSPPGRPHMKDSRIFEYIGWRLARGERLYLDLWEVKPPVSFEVTAILAWVSGGDVTLFHWLNVAASSVAAVASVALVGVLVHEVTEDGVAAVTAGLALYLLPAFHLRAGYGFKAKYVVVAVGLLAVLLALRERPFWAGVAAAVAVGTWQFGLVFPLVVLGIAGQSRDVRAVGWVVAGGLAGSAVVLAPVVWWGAVEAMIVETLLVGQYVPENETALGRLSRLPYMFHHGESLAAVGLLGGGGVALWRHRERAWWVPVVGAWFLAGIVFVDLDSYPDLFPMLAAAALGLGLVVPELRKLDARAGRALVGATLAVAVVNVLFLGGFGLLADPLGVATDPEIAPADEVEPPFDKPEKRALLWHDLDTERCHVFVARTEWTWVQRTDRDMNATTCGQWPTVGPGEARRNATTAIGRR